MNNILKSTLRVSCLRSLLKPIKNVASTHYQYQITRNLWAAANSRTVNFSTNTKHSHLCNCGCNLNKRLAHSKGKLSKTYYY